MQWTWLSLVHVPSSLQLPGTSWPALAVPSRLNHVIVHRILVCACLQTNKARVHIRQQAQPTLHAYVGKACRVLARLVLGTHARTRASKHIAWMHVRCCSISRAHCAHNTCACSHLQAQYLHALTFTSATHARTDTACEDNAARLRVKTRAKTT